MKFLKNRIVQLAAITVCLLIFVAVAFGVQRNPSEPHTSEQKIPSQSKKVDKENHIKIHVYANPVFISSETATQEAQVKEGQIIPAGSTIRTGETGRAEIQYPNHSVTRLNFNTKVKVTFFMPEPQVSMVDVLQGSIWNRVARLLGKESFSTETPTMVATVRGTAYRMGILSDGTQVVAVKAGAVSVDAGGMKKPVIMPGNMQMTYNPLYKTSNMTSMSPSQKDEWTLFNEEQDVILMKKMPNDFVKDTDEAVLGASTQSGNTTTTTVKINCTGPDGVSFLATQTDCDSMKKFWSSPTGVQAAEKAAQAHYTPTPTVVQPSSSTQTNNTNNTVTNTTNNAKKAVPTITKAVGNATSNTTRNVPTVVPTIPKVIPTNPPVRIPTAVPTMPPVIPTAAATVPPITNNTNSGTDTFNGNGNKNGLFEVFTNCVSVNGNTLTVYFGYDNKASLGINLNVSEFSGGTGSAPTLLLPGRHDKAASASTDTSQSQQITWKANGNSSTGTTGSPACQ